jgi:hypothetical protein
MTSLDMLEEATERREAAIACRHLVAAHAFQIIQESKDQFGIEVDQPQSIDGNIASTASVLK